MTIYKSELLHRTYMHVCQELNLELAYTDGKIQECNKNIKD